MAGREFGDVILRPATVGDAVAVAALYAYHVLNGVGTFEEVPPTPPQTAGRIATVQDRGLPFYVAEADGAIQAFAYASPFRMRAAYRHTLETSVYVAQDARRSGYGRAVMAPVITACEALDIHQLIAVIGGSDNAGSIGLHTALGYRMAGRLEGVGYKAGRWIDVIQMQRPLNGGAGAAPRSLGVSLP